MVRPILPLETRRALPVRTTSSHRTVCLLTFCLSLFFATTVVAQRPPATFTEFQAPGAGTGSLEGTLAVSINSLGIVSGFYYDSSGVAHGFVRATSGAITDFDAPNAGTGAGQGTFGGQLNTAGEIAGNLTDNSGVHHGFIRTSSGTITDFDDPSAGILSGQGTQCCGLNTSGTA